MQVCQHQLSFLFWVTLCSNSDWYKEVCVNSEGYSDSKGECVYKPSYNVLGTQYVFSGCTAVVAAVMLNAINKFMNECNHMWYAYMNGQQYVSTLTEAHILLPMSGLSACHICITQNLGVDW